MKNDRIKQYLGLRDALVREKQAIESRLGEIAQVLGTETSGTTETVSRSAPSRPPTGVRRGRHGGLSLKSAVLQATAGKALSKEEILEAVKRLGYRFSTQNPLNSLGVILYGKSPKFRNDGGRFSYDGPPLEMKNAEADPAEEKKPRRKISAEGLARIAAAQRARWAKVKKLKRAG